MEEKTSERQLLVIQTLELLVDEVLDHARPRHHAPAWWYPDAAAVVAPPAARLEALRAQLHQARLELEEQLEIETEETEQSELEAAV
jgi:hypothetical protein